MYLARDERKISIDDEVNRYIPEFKIKTYRDVETGRPMTFRQLASHLAGLPRENPVLLMDGFPKKF